MRAAVKLLDVHWNRPSCHPQLPVTYNMDGLCFVLVKLKQITPIITIGFVI